MDFFGIVVVVVLFGLGMYFLSSNSNRDISSQDELIDDNPVSMSSASEPFFKTVTEAQLNQVINYLRTIAACLKFIVFLIVCRIVAKVALLLMSGVAIVNLIDAINQVLKGF